MCAAAGFAARVALLPSGEWERERIRLGQFTVHTCASSRVSDLLALARTPSCTFAHERIIEFKPRPPCPAAARRAEPPGTPSARRVSIVCAGEQGESERVEGGG